jgi:hypothetical protein
MKLILIGHTQNVGKDTLAGLIKKNYRKPTYVVHFADAVKDVAWGHFSHVGLRRKEYYNLNYGEKNQPLSTGVTPRDIWIMIGHGFRQIDPDIWVDLVNRDYILPHITEDCIIVIPDVRYPNELFPEYDPIKIKVKRAAVPISDDPADSALRDFDGWDYVVENNGTIEDMETWLTTHIKI